MEIDLISLGIGFGIGIVILGIVLLFRRAKKFDLSKLKDDTKQSTELISSGCQKIHEGYADLKESFDIVERLNKTFSKLENAQD